MSKNLQYVRVLELLQSAKGPVKVSDVKALDGIVPTRLSTYLWEIKKNTGFAVKSNRDGRAVVSYELVGSGVVPSPKVVQVSKVATTKTTAKATTKATAKPAPAKVTKVAKAKTIASEMQDDVLPTAKMAKNANVFDALDEIDTTADFEDRAYASQYVRGM
jgi:hypothetical protein